GMREHYRFFFEQIADGVWRAEVDPPLPVDAGEEEQVRRCATGARLVECNEAMLRMYACDAPAQLVGTRLCDSFDLADPRSLGFFRAFVRGGYRASDLESYELDRQGQPRCFLNNLVGVVENGRLTCIWGTQRDITERKAGEEAVRAARNQLAALVQASPLPIVGIRATGEVVSWNPAAETVFGWTAEQTIGRRLLNIPSDKQEEFDGLRARVASGNPFTGFETRRLRRDGTLLDVSISTAPLQDAEGKTNGLVAIYTDITGRRRAEEELRQSQEELRQAQKMEAVGRLAGGIAHDFNNLLTAILSYSEMLLGELPAGAPMREDLEQIRQAGTRAAELTNQLLAFSRRQLLQLRSVSLNEVVTAVDRILRRLIGEDIELRTELAGDLRLTRADPGQMEQVLLNLAVNSRDAMPAGGRLTISTANAEVGEVPSARWGRLEPGAYVTLTVRDTGSGMSHEVQERIFEPFFTTKEQGKGTGLGLATVYGIVRQVGGHVFVTSAEGAGSVFTIYLPAGQDGGEPLARAVPTPPVRGASETILLVEDEQLVRNLTREILVRNGYEVLQAADGLEALRAAAAYDGAIHLMLTDVVMPRMSGRELVERILPLRPDMRVLYVSGYSDEAIARQGQLTQGVELLPKPFTPGVLTAKIREILDRDP
ncbi:MAG: PAS domain S-box protein, partial [Gemmatimonadales bacterium]|nr:PAS domain S-box protein [Gemmatimonadales bacterium]